MAINVDKMKALAGRLKRRPTDVVALDIATSGIKVVRAQKSDDGIIITGVDILDAVPVPESGEAVVDIVPLELQKELAGRYVSFAVSSKGAVIKLLTFPGRADADGLESRIVEGLGIEDLENYRIGYKLVQEGHGKTESRAMVVAVPENEAGYVCKMFPSGLPAPYAVEVAGLASMTAFLHGPGKQTEEDAIGVIEFGAGVSYFAIFHKQVPVLIRKFDFGSALILEKVQQSLGIDQATAQGILSDGSFDISQQISDVLDGFIKQVIVSRDFVERRENCRISKVYASGGVTASRDWLLELKSALGYDVELWNPFDMATVEEGAIPETLLGQESRFSAAVGIALSTLLEDDE